MESNNEQDIEAFMVHLERENYQSYINHLEKQRVYILSKIETPAGSDYIPTPETPQKVKSLSEKIIASLEKELADNKTPYQVEDLNTKVLERRDYYLGEFKELLSDIDTMLDFRK